MCEVNLPKNRWLKNGLIFSVKAVFQLYLYECVFLLFYTFYII